MSPKNDTRRTAGVKMAENPQIDWRKVVEQIRSGDSAGEEILYRELSGGSRLFLKRRLGTPDVEDHVHEVFVTVIQAILGGSIREPERLMGFVRTILYRQLNLAISRIVGTRETAAAIDTASRLPAGEPDPEERLLFQERVDAIRRGLKKMKDKDAEILTRYYLRGQQPERICREMELTQTQFALRKSRAKALLYSLVHGSKNSSSISRR